VFGRAQAALALSPPDIARWRDANAGIDYVHRRASAEPGAHALIAALMHGNEICGAVALDRLLASDFRPRRGIVTLAFLNVAAYEARRPTRKGPLRYVDEDMNRVWSRSRLEGTEHSTELARARALRPLVDAADYLLDLHSMVEDEEPLLLCGAHERGLAFARRVGYPATVVADAGHAAGVRMRDYGPFGAAAGERSALLVECGPHGAAASAEVAFETCLRFLASLDMIEPTDVRRYLATPPASQRFVQVTHAITIETDDFVFLRPCRTLEIIPEAGTLFARDGTRELRTPYDACVPIMPTRMRRRGTTAVRLGRFVTGPAAG
jgi:predicted deacylase